MFDFIRKPDIWKHFDAGFGAELQSTMGFQLKTMQDVAVYASIRDLSGKAVGEIGGGNSRILPRLVGQNECYNIEPFEGADNGPEDEVTIDGVTNLRTRVGVFDPTLSDAKFDTLFSVSVVEHVEDSNFVEFWSDCIRILKVGGEMYHAIDMYLEDEPGRFWLERFSMYLAAVSDDDRVEPIGSVFSGPCLYTNDIASNPDNVMYNWKKISPSLDTLRQQAQSVSLLIGVRKKP